MTALRRPGESAAQALRRLDRDPAYPRLVVTQSYQDLLIEASRAADEARRLTARASRRGEAS